MKIINNRYIIDKMVRKDQVEETYLIKDSWNKDEMLHMRILDSNKDKDIIIYFLEEFIRIAQIKHASLLNSYYFGIVETINLKITNSTNYYIISEYTDLPLLNHCDLANDLNHKLYLILDIISAIDYLHFRGITYKFLCPSNIFYSKDQGIKLMNLSTTEMKLISTFSDSMDENFLAPEALMNNLDLDQNSDKYSIGIIMKYLLLNNYLSESANQYEYKEELNLSTEEETFLNSTINDLTKSMPANRTLPLRQIIKDIVRVFNLDYSYNLVMERNTLFLNTPIIGSSRELNEILSSDIKIEKNANYYKGIVVHGDSGLGKTKLLQEASFRLGMRCRNVYYVNCSKIMNKDYISIFLKKISRKVPENIKNKYEDDLLNLIPLIKDDYNNYQLNVKLRLFNRVCNFVSDVSKDSINYIIVENIEKATFTFLQFLDYLIRNTSKNRIFFLMSYNESSRISNGVCEYVYNWTKNFCTTSIYLKPLSLEDTGKFVKEVLGVSYIPYNFISSIYNESKGIPSYITLIIKDLHDRKQLYINDEGQWEIINTGILRLNIPSNINKAILNQLREYKASYLDLIKILSIYNMKVTKETIISMTNIDEEKLDRILNDLVKDRLVEESIGDLGYYYCLLSEELQRYSYISIPEDEKLEYHSKASDVFMQLYEGNYRLILDELVYHLQKSKKCNIAVEIITKEAEESDIKNISNSIKLWEMAYNISDDIPRNSKLKILDNLTNFYQIKGNTEKADFYLSKFLEETKNTNDIEYYLKSKEYQSESLLKNNRLNELSEEIAELEYVDNTYNCNEAKILAYVISAKLLIRGIEIDKAIEIIQCAISISNKHNIDRYLAQLYNLYGLANFYYGNKVKAIELFKKSIQYCEIGNKPYTMVIPINNIGNVYADSYGDLKKSLEYYIVCLEISNKYGLKHLKKLFLNNMGENYNGLLDYNKSLEHLEKSRIIADNCNDISLVFLSSINLGYVYLNTNQFNKAYRVSMYLQRINLTNSISDMDIKYKYNNFLGEFYYKFNKLDLAEGYSILARDFFKVYNIKEYLRAETRLAYIRYQLKGHIDKDDIYFIINQYEKTQMIDEKLYFILTMAKLALINGDKDFSIMMLDIYDDLNHDSNSDLLVHNSQIIKLLLNTSEAYLDETDKVLNNNSAEIFKADVDFRVYLGFQYLSKENYPKALRQFLEAIDGLYKIWRNLPDNDLKYSLLESKNPDYIREQIAFIFRKGYNKNIGKVFNKKASIENFKTYFNINKVIDSLSKKEFYDILYYHDENANIVNIMDLLSSISDNYKDNLKLILNYIAIETISKRGMIIKIDEETELIEPIVSLNSDDTIPDEIILQNSIKSKGPFLFNINIKGYNNSKIGSMFPSDITAVICVPIFSYENINYERIERRKIEPTSDNRLLGFVYLETDRILNRFDMESYTLISSLISLISLNIENDRLRRISTIDRVTGTNTRKYFEDKLDRILHLYNNTNNSFSLLMIDIDRFKNINDTYGHLKGDEVLFIIGQTLLNCVRETDLVGRYGGEEYLVLLNNTTIEEALERANIIRQSIEEIKFPSIARPITVSIGISQYPVHGKNKNELVFKADQALYYAKEVLGRNQRSLWHSGMDIASNKVDKLTGLMTGDPIRDNQIMLAIADISYLNIEEKALKEKAFDFLGRLIEIVGGETGSLIIYDNNNPVDKFTRIRKETTWINNDFINYNLINKVSINKVGAYFIDWDNVEIDENILEDPNWQAILIVPMIKQVCLKGIVYITVPLKEKEFDSVDLNICNLLSNIFVGSIN